MTDGRPPMPTHETEGAGRGLSEEETRLRSENAVLRKALNGERHAPGPSDNEHGHNGCCVKCLRERAEGAEAEAACLRAQVAAVKGLTDELERWCRGHCRACRDAEFAARHAHDCGITQREVADRIRAALGDAAVVRAEAWDEGFTACAQEFSRQRREPGHPITRTNPYRGGDDGRA